VVGTGQTGSHTGQGIVDFCASAELKFLSLRLRSSPEINFLSRISTARESSTRDWLQDFADVGFFKITNNTFHVEKLDILKRNASLLQSLPKVTCRRTWYTGYPLPCGTRSTLGPCGTLHCCVVSLSGNCVVLPHSS
jgi:hypothetical protein